MLWDPFRPNQASQLSLVVFFVKVAGVFGLLPRIPKGQWSHALVAKCGSYAANTGPLMRKSVTLELNIKHLQTSETFLFFCESHVRFKKQKTSCKITVQTGVQFLGSLPVLLKANQMAAQFISIALLAS